MSLVGNLEDLGLGEILQIVSLSKKSGILQLSTSRSSGDREGQIIFRHGHVIRASSSSYPENLGDLLLRSGIVGIDTLKKALILQQDAEERRRIGDILSEEFGVDQSSIEQVIREHVERIVYSFFNWKEGAFAFELEESHEVAATSLDPLQFMLDQGLNPQWLAVEGARIHDEKQHDDEEEQGESFVDASELLAGIIQSEDVVQVDEQAAEPVNRVKKTFPRMDFLVVNGDPDTAEHLTRALHERKARVRTFTDASRFLEAVRKSEPQGMTLLVDLDLPGLDGAGHGSGLELLNELINNHPQFELLAMSEHPDPIEDHALQKQGVSAVLTKPSKQAILEDRAEQSLAHLAEALIAGRPTDREVPEHGELYNIGLELMNELGELHETDQPAPPQLSPGLNLLHGMLQELNNPDLGGGVTLLILRFASELMNRAVLFVVKGDEIAGLGQFGIELSGESADAKVRNTNIPIGEPNLFSKALQTLSPCKLRPEDNRWDNYLFDQLGGHRPKEVFVGPLISRGRVVALLYGDKLPEQKVIGDTETLEIFLSQAGLAMEKALIGHGGPA